MLLGVELGVELGLGVLDGVLEGVYEGVLDGVFEGVELGLGVELGVKLGVLEPNSTLNTAIADAGCTGFVAVHTTPCAAVDAAANSDIDT